MRKNFLERAGSRLTGVLSFLILAIVISSCNDFLDTEEPVATPYAEVAFYHASPDAPPLNVTVDSKNLFNGEFDFADYSGYLRFYTGSRHFNFNRYNAANVLVDTTFNFVDGRSYSVFVINQLSGIETLITTDSAAAAPAEGKAMVRFVQLSPDTAPVDVAAEGGQENVFTDVSYKEASAFKEVAAGKLKVVLKHAGASDALLTSSEVTLVAGRFYTIISRGFSNPPEGNPNALSVQVVANE